MRVKSAPCQLRPKIVHFESQKGLLDVFLGGDAFSRIWQLKSAPGQLRPKRYPRGKAWGTLEMAWGRLG